MNISADKVVDAKGLSCPMPIVRTKKGMEEIQPGQVLELQATDKGSLADIQGWARTTGHQYIGTIEDGEVYRHFLRKASQEEEKTETKYPHTLSNDEILNKLSNKETFTLLDVREQAEYVFGHIPGAISIPMGELEERLNELNPEEEIYVICRTGSRSDLACRLLDEKGFKNVKNILPGMTAWNGELDKSNS